MKAKIIIPQEDRWVVPANLAQPMPQTNEADHLYLIEEILPFLGIGQAPDATDCEDLNYMTYLRATALAEMIAYGDQALEEIGTKDETPTIRAMEALQLQLQIMRLANATLFRLHRESTAKTPRQKSA